MHSPILLRRILSHELYRALRISNIATRKCYIHHDGRQRLSNFWAPTGGIEEENHIKGDSHSLLHRAGYVRQTHSGIFHFLPLGLRVQQKIEKLLDKHMTALGASKLSLSTLSSEALWQRSGRLHGDRSELFQLEDRKGARFLLSPTHEEEITSLVANAVHSYRDLPLRLYQITRKYRDEARPRQGLLRSREFLMKDLYTFDASTKDALQTYHGVREAYSAFFNELKLPYLSAEADSGSIGGDLSHEYHILSPKGEDRIIRCSSCDYIANEELVKGGSEPFLKELHDGRIQAPEPSLSERILSFELLADLNPFFSIVYGFNRDRKTKYIVIYPSFVAYGHEGDEREATLNLDVLKSTFPELEALDPAAGRPTETDRIGMKTQYVFDYRISEFLKSSCKEFLSTQRNTEVDFGDIAIVDLVKIEEGDGCPKCEGGILEAHTSIELGHTFNLGTKYSKRLNARVPGYSPSTGIQQHTTTKNQVSLEEVEGTSVKEEADSQIFLEMGCYGIGVSRLIAAVADSLADGKGLNWPRVIAPFEAVVIPIPGFEYDANVVLDLLSQEAVVLPLVTPHRSRTIDAILDDRPKNLAWKLRDADLIGYPILVVLGRAWKNERKCEVQCRQLGSLRQEVPLQELRGFVDGLLAKLSHLPSTHQL